MGRKPNPFTRPYKLTPEAIEQRRIAAIDRWQALADAPKDARSLRAVGFLVSFAIFLGVLSITPHGLPAWEQWLILAIPFACFYLVTDPRGTWVVIRSIPSRIGRVVGPIVGIASILGLVFAAIWIIIRLIHWMWVNSPV